MSTAQPGFCRFFQSRNHFDTIWNISFLYTLKSKASVAGASLRNGEMVPKIRAKVLKYYHSIEISICCRIESVDKSRQRKETFVTETRHGPLDIFDQTRGVYFWQWKKTIYLYLPSSGGYDVMLYALSSINHMKWIIKIKSSSRWSSYTIFSKHVLCIETDRSDVRCLYQLDTR